MLTCIVGLVASVQATRKGAKNYSTDGLLPGLVTSITRAGGKPTVTPEQIRHDNVVMVKLQ